MYRWLTWERFEALGDGVKDDEAALTTYVGGTVESRQTDLGAREA